jgi:hypothetical protein
MSVRAQVAHNAGDSSRRFVDVPHLGAVHLFHLAWRSHEKPDPLMATIRDFGFVAAVVGMKCMACAWRRGGCGRGCAGCAIPCAAKRFMPMREVRARILAVLASCG